MNINFELDLPPKLTLPPLRYEPLYRRVTNFKFVHFEGDRFRRPGPIVERNELDSPYNLLYVFNEGTMEKYAVARAQLLNDCLRVVMISGRDSLRVAKHFNLQNIIRFSVARDAVDMDELLVKCWRRYMEGLKRQNRYEMVQFLIDLMMPTVDRILQTTGANELEPIVYYDGEEDLKSNFTSSDEDIDDTESNKSIECFEGNVEKKGGTKLEGNCNHDRRISDQQDSANHHKLNTEDICSDKERGFEEHNTPAVSEHRRGVLRLSHKVSLFNGSSADGQITMHWKNQAAQESLASDHPSVVETSVEVHLACEPESSKGRLTKSKRFNDDAEILSHLNELHKGNYLCTESQDPKERGNNDDNETTKPKHPSLSSLHDTGVEIGRTPKVDTSNKGPYPRLKFVYWDPESYQKDK